MPAYTRGAEWLGLLRPVGGSHLDEYVFNLNLMYKPMPSLAIIPSLRLQEQVMDAHSSGSQTLGANTPVPLVRAAMGTGSMCGSAWT
jgi:hypothetical protein